ncbi:hypothetical protein ACHAXR_007600 [Thalassiosira sp. AJA248-18]
MLRRAASISTKKCTTARLAVSKWPHNLRHSLPTSSLHVFPSRLIERSPYHTLKSAACFSSVPHLLEIKESKNDGNKHSVDYTPAASHAALKSLGDEKLKIQQERAERASRKKELSRRRILAEELMQIFATNDECFNETLQELNVNKKWGSDSGLTEYRQFYLDSLQSFGVLLSEGDDNENTLAEIGLNSASAVHILEQFAMGGFSDNARALSKKYRKMATMMKTEEELNSTLEQLRKKHEQRLQKLKVETERLEIMKAEKSSERDKHIASLGQKVKGVKDVLPLLKASGENNYTTELDKLEEELTKALSQVAELSQDKSVDNDFEFKRAKAEATNLTNRVNALESEISRLKWPITQDEFQSITENVMRIVPQCAPSLAKFITNRHDDFDRYRQLEMHTDLTSPHEWYPHSRLDKRKITFHAGPTNSGKTYNALQRLKQAEKGMYLAPLRLLAAETYESLTAEGIYTDLLTGQEQRKVPFSTHRSSTVELACIEEDYDVVVIDEIQMLSDDFRGFAWTRALLGVRSKEIHVCGGAEAIDIVKKLTAMCGDEFQLHQYKRFSDLKVLSQSFAKSSTAKGSYARVEPGDCVVAFSRNDIFAIKREIEELTPYKCCVIYGALPPHVRSEQARRFNDPNSGYDILVASDAIGMGLNLSIKRIIFNSMFKNNGENIVQLDHSAVKQIAGRAGRRNSPYPHGECTTRDPNDMAHLRKCMRTEIKPLKKAGLIPTPSHIAQFNQHLEEYGSSKKIELHQTLRKFSEMATLKGAFFLCRKRSIEIVSHWLKDINMTPLEKFAICMSPVNESCPKSRRVLLRYVEKYSSGKTPGIHSSMRPKPAKSFEHLSDLCSVHHQLELFLWLQNKLPSNAVEVVRAVTLKERTIDMINNGLFNAEKLSLRHDYISKDENVKRKWAEERRDEGHDG